MPQLTLQLTFHEAVERVRNEKGAAFAYCPFTHERATPGDVDPLGANLYVLTYCSDHESRPDGNPECCVHYIGGWYWTSSPVRERYRPGNAPLEARKAIYRFLRKFDETMLHGDLQAIHRELQRSAEPV